jgi:integrase
MARQGEKLKADTVARLKEPGYYNDGFGLWLRIGPTGAKSWVFRYREGRTKNGKPAQREMGLGPCHTINLAEARQKALECRKARLDGIDPIAERQAAKASKQVATAKATTFRQCAEGYIAAHEVGWRSDKHRDQWSASLASYVYPVLGNLPVSAIDVGLVLKVLEPIWSDKPETASRVRGRIEPILDWATGREYRTGENPARWRGRLEAQLPKKQRVKQVRHHKALPYQDVGEFMVSLRGQYGAAARALEFTILTAARTGEVLGATWDEVDLRERVWVIPANRIKAGKEHRVPLSGAALAAMGQPGSGFIFPGQQRGRLSKSAMEDVLKRMGAEATVHGFRSTFSDWCAERTNYAREVREMALAHAVGDKVEAAYRRGDLFEKRRRLAEEWAAYCARVELAGEVVPLRAG